MDDKLHPAATITNIKQAIPITLDLESGQYIAWSTLFKLHTRAHLVYDHIIPPTPDPSQKSTAPIVGEIKPLYGRDLTPLFYNGFTTLYLKISSIPFLTWLNSHGRNLLTFFRIAKTPKNTEMILRWVFRYRIMRGICNREFWRVGYCEDK